MKKTVIIRCPSCNTHPKLIDSGYERLAKICPVCKIRYPASWEEEPPKKYVPDIGEKKNLPDLWKVRRKP